MTVEMPRTQMNLSETALDEARHALGSGLIGKLKVYASDSGSLVARRLQGAHGFELVIIPDHLLLSSYSWGAEFNGNHYWSNPA